LNKGDHIKISYFVDKLPARVRTSVSIFSHSLIAILHGYLIFLSIEWIQSVGYFESPVLQIPQGIVQVCIPISGVLVVFFGVKHIYSTHILLKRRRPEDNR